MHSYIAYFYVYRSQIYTILLILNDLLRTLVKYAEQAIDWYNITHMLAKPDKFQAIVLSKSDSPVSRKSNNSETAKSVKLLGFEIDH